MNVEYLLIMLVGTAAITDIRSRRIPNVLIAVGLSTAFLLHVFLPFGGSWQTWLLGALTGFGLLLPFYLVRGMAAGDVKLMAAVGSFVGPAAAVKIALSTFVIGGFWALVVIVSSGKIRDVLTNLHLILQSFLLRIGDAKAQPCTLPQSIGRMPYGVAIALGTLTVLFLSPYW